MITQMEHVILGMIRIQLLGKKVPNHVLGATGRGFEDLLEDIGVPVNRKNGVDSVAFDWEFKTRQTGKTSSQTVGSMLPKDVIAIMNWKDTPVYKKIRKQLRATISENGIITEIDLFDFDQEFIQDIFEADYKHARSQIVKNPGLIYTKYKKENYGYFENTDPKRTRSLDFRISNEKMDKLKAMAKSTFSQLIEYDN